MSIVTRSEASTAIIDDVSETDDSKDLDYLDAEKTSVEIEGRKQFFKLQKGWSNAIMAWISCLILFNAALTVLVGAGILDFTSAPWFVTAVTVETFLQVVGLGYVAARYLFSSDKGPGK
jgi:hypothetical protein